MPITATFERERLELKAILDSGLFSRAPNLAQLLTYICSKYFDGATNDIKEYNIAVEALGRSEAFDQKRDSIVRVEAYRLRKRLREYYENGGAGHDIQIEVPSGQYTPRFVYVSQPADEDSSGSSEVILPLTAESNRDAVPMSLEKMDPGGTADVSQSGTAPSMVGPPLLVPPPLRGYHEGRGIPWLRWAAAIAICTAAAGVLLSRVLAPGSAAPHVAEAPAPSLPLDTVRILAGVEGGSYVDSFERTWQSDRYFDGGWLPQSPRSQVVQGTRDQELYRRRREGPFRYDIPLAEGVYQLRLYFAESFYGENNLAGGGETTRIFDVLANGKPLLSGFDVIADAGASVGDIKVFRDITPAPDGKLHLDFRPGTNQPFVNAIEIAPGVAGRMAPVRIVARDRGMKDAEGRYWDPDHYARGGQIIPRPMSNVQGADPELYRSERFGNLTYTIPVAQPGRYAVNLYFTENWFGPGNPGGGGIGSRAFDILINGVALRRNFDILKESGGVNRSEIVGVHGVEPNHQGKIVISLTPNENYACINALEILDESK